MNTPQTRFITLSAMKVTNTKHTAINGNHSKCRMPHNFSCHTLVWGEYYLYHIIITRSCGASHSYVWYYLFQPAKTGCFRYSTHYIAKYSTVFTFKKYQFSLVNVFLFVIKVVYLQPKEFFDRLKHLKQETISIFWCW